MAQTFKVLLTQIRAVFHAFAVQYVTFYGKLTQNSCGPLPELRRPHGIDPVAYRNDGIEVVELGHVTFTVCGSIPEFPDN